jgi:spore protease
LGKLISKFTETGDIDMPATRTDLAMEAFENTDEGAIPGACVNHWDTDGIRITEVKITDNEAAQLLDKPKGTYLTMECPLLLERDPDARLAMASLLAEEIARVLPDGDGRAPVLVVGLGNRAVTPDAVGPWAVEQTVVTRHLVSALPEQFGRFRPVSAVATGVLGTTGVESGELVRALCGQLRPSAVVAVDALAARSAHRLCNTIQLSDTGIVPGSGVGNARNALTQETLGVPVVAVGVPTVVDAATLCADLGGGPPPEGTGSMFVTPRDIDTRVRIAARLAGYGVNLALQDGLTISDVDMLLS